MSPKTGLPTLAFSIIKSLFKLIVTHNFFPLNVTAKDNTATSKYPARKPTQIALSVQTNKKASIDDRSQLIFSVFEYVWCLEVFFRLILN